MRQRQDNQQPHQQLPTIVTQEVGDNARHVGQPAHRALTWSCVMAAPRTSLAETKIRTASQEKSKYRPASGMMDRSAKGHSMPRPSPAQNVPNVESMTPTIHFMVFSGTCCNGLRTRSP